MGARGPKPGFKKARAQQQGAETPPSAKSAPVVSAVVPPVVSAVESAFVQPAIVTDPAMVRLMPTAHRENPAKLGGEALRHYAHQCGISRSEADRLDDVKLRQQLNMLAYHKRDTEEV